MLVYCPEEINKVVCLFKLFTYIFYNFNFENKFKISNLNKFSHIRFNVIKSIKFCIKISCHIRIYILMMSAASTNPQFFRKNLLFDIIRDKPVHPVWMCPLQISPISPSSPGSCGGDARCTAGREIPPRGSYLLSYLRPPVLRLISILSKSSQDLIPYYLFTIWQHNKNTNRGRWKRDAASSLSLHLHNRAFIFYLSL